MSISGWSKYSWKDDSMFGHIEQCGARGVDESGGLVELVQKRREVWQKQQSKGCLRVSRSWIQYRSCQASKNKCQIESENYFQSK